jgi:hypothetical protein
MLFGRDLGGQRMHCNGLVLEISFAINNRSSTECMDQAMAIIAITIFTGSSQD